jgi:Flp pilus assembly protein TadD
MARTVLASWPTANAHYLVGTELAAAGDRREAIPELREATVGYPPAHFDLGRVLVEVGETEEGSSELQRFIQQEPDALAARAAEGLIADALASHQSFAEAVPHYRKYLEAYPKDGAAWTGLGVALAATGQRVGATNAFRSAADLSPGDPHAQTNLARSMIDSGDMDGALAIVQQQISAHPDAPPYDLLGRILAARGDVPGARQAFERALTIDPGFVPAREALADLSRLQPSKAIR